MTTISIALATYNGERYLRQQLESLASQSSLPCELVVADDGSSDRTRDIIEDFARTAPFDVALHVNEARLGYKANFMKCVSLCHGDLIALCDQDDVWYADKLTRQSEALNTIDILLACHDADLIDETGTPLNRRRNSIPGRHGRESFDTLEPFAHCPGFALMFRRSLLSCSDLWPSSVNEYSVREQQSHDRWMFFLASTLGFVHIDPKPLAAYRQHASNASGQAHRQSFATQLVTSVKTRLDEYERTSRAAKNRSDILTMIAENPPVLGDIPHETLKRRAVLASDKYASLARALKRRRDLYGSEQLQSRMKAFAALVHEGDYHINDAWSFSPKGLAFDVLVALLGHRFIQSAVASSGRGPVGQK